MRRKALAGPPGSVAALGTLRQPVRYLDVEPARVPRVTASSSSFFALWLLLPLPSPFLSPQEKGGLLRESVGGAPLSHTVWPHSVQRGPDL